MYPSIKPHTAARQRAPKPRPPSSHAALLPSDLTWQRHYHLCSNHSLTHRQGGDTWGIRGGRVLVKPLHLLLTYPDRGNYSSPRTERLAWPSLLGTLVDGIKSPSLREEAIYCVCFPSISLQMYSFFNKMMTDYPRSYSLLSSSNQLHATFSPTPQQLNERSTCNLSR